MHTSTQITTILKPQKPSTQSASILSAPAHAVWLQTTILLLMVMQPHADIKSRNSIILDLTIPVLMFLEQFDKASSLTIAKPDLTTLSLSS
jgi:hypothetical protein